VTDSFCELGHIYLLSCKLLIRLSKAFNDSVAFFHILFWSEWQFTWHNSWTLQFKLSNQVKNTSTFASCL
jgi:hypothetical protein